MSRSEPTYVGEIQNVAGAVVSIRLREDMQSALVLVGGESYRVGQVGAFIRIPLGYTNLYGVCTQVGAAASPHLAEGTEPGANKWLTAALFGESISGRFERGVSQYPTVGDEVHLVTSEDLEVIYGSLDTSASITVGRLGAASGIAGVLDLGRLVARHCAIVGSTGTGKSNLVAVLLESIAEQNFPSARVIVIDPHGEYGESVEDRGVVFRVRPQRDYDRPLVVPFWALPFDELCAIGMGPMQPGGGDSSAGRDR